MFDKTLEISSNFKFLVTIVWLVIIILNFAIGIIISFWWKSWKNFKEDQRNVLSDFFTSHIKEHDLLFLKISTIENNLDAKAKDIAENITALFTKEDDDRDKIIKTERDINNINEKLKDHIRRCEIRDQCHDRRKNDR